MRLLLDTHVFLWMIAGDKRLSKSHKDLIRDPANEVYLSAISVWEAVVKYSSGKLNLAQPPEILLPAERDLHGILSLPLDERTVLRLSNLPPIHRDPFDRMLICQALEYGLSLVSDDPLIRSYPVSVL